jgi:hypothetical protein
MDHSYKSCIDACYACVTACDQCATACLKEDDIKILARCISLERECALVCGTTAQLLSMEGENAMLLCSVCSDLCIACAEECEQHAHMDHCKQCAEQCRKCAEECKHMIAIEIY